MKPEIVQEMHDFLTNLKLRQIEMEKQAVARAFDELQRLNENRRRKRRSRSRSSSTATSSVYSYSSRFAYPLSMLGICNHNFI